MDRLRALQHSDEPGARLLPDLRPVLSPLRADRFSLPAVCAAINLPGAAYCETCGAALPARPYLIVDEYRPARCPSSAAIKPPSSSDRSDALSGVAPDLDLEPYAGELAGLSRRHARLILARRSLLDRRPQQRQLDVPQQSTPVARAARAAERRRSAAAGQCAADVSRGIATTSIQQKPPGLWRRSGGCDLSLHKELLLRGQSAGMPGADGQTRRMTKCAQSGNFRIPMIGDIQTDSIRTCRQTARPIAMSHGITTTPYCTSAGH